MIILFKAIYRIFLAVLMLIFISSSSLIAQQTYFITYGGTNDEVIRAIDTTFDHGYVMGGYTESYGYGQRDIFILKTDSSGNIAWSKAIGGTGNDECWGMIQAKDGNILVTGTTESYGNGQRDAFLLKLDPNGNLLWSKTFGGPSDDIGYKIFEFNGKILLVAKTLSFGAGGSDGFLIRLDQSGNVIWAKTYGTPSNDGLFAVTMDGNDLVFAGSTLNFGTYDITTSKIDTSGNVLWANYYDGGGLEIGADICLAHNGGYVISGYSDSFSGSFDAVLLKTDNTGVTDWAKTYGGASDDISYTIVEAQNNRYLISGYTMSYGFGNEDVFVWETDLSGNVQWAKTYGGINLDGSGAPNNIVFKNILQKPNGNIIIGDHFSSFGAGMGDFGLIKATSSGDINNCPHYLNITPTVNTVSLTATPFTFSISTPSNYYHSYTFNSMNIIPVRTNVCFDSCSITVNLGHDTTICIGDSIIFNASPGYAQYHWQNGSTGQTFKATTAGFYSVTVTDSTGCTAQDTVHLNVILPPNNISLGNDTSFCQGHTLVLNPGAGYPNYLWQNGSTNQTFTVSTTGLYSATVSNQCGISADSINVTVNPLPNVNIGHDTSICTGASLVLNADTGFTSYLWQDGSTNQTYHATAAGSYSVKVTDANGCTASDQLSLTIQQPPVVNLGSGGDLCNPTQVALDAGSGISGQQYLWQDGTFLPTYLVIAKGTYSVTVSNSCGSVTDSVHYTACPECNIDLPNAFSPNGDGQNDVLYVLGNGFKNMQLRIYDRHGEKVFESSDPAVGWDGYYKGKKQENEVYYYYLTADCLNGHTLQKKGDITLLN